MKKLRTSNIILACCLMLCFCKKEETPPAPPPEFLPIHCPCDTSYGFASGDKLTAAWKAGVNCRSYLVSGKKFWLIEITTCSNDGSTREKVYFGRIPDSNPTQQYQIHKTQDSIPNGNAVSGYSTFLSDGDVLEDFYYTDTLASNNFLKIETWDEVHKRISGSFQVSFEIKEPRRSNKNPKKVTFSSGKFWAKLPD